MRPPRIEDRGLLSASGHEVPTDETDGYQTGAFFQKTDSQEGAAVFVNLGTVESSLFRQVLLYEPE